MSAIGEPKVVKKAKHALTITAGGKPKAAARTSKNWRITARSWSPAPKPSES